MSAQQTSKTPPLAEVLADDNLQKLRQAYRALEAFQLSDEHFRAKALLNTKLAEKDSPGDTDQQGSDT